MQEDLKKGIRILHDVDYVAVDIASGKIYNLFLKFLKKYSDNIVDCAAITGRNEDGLLRMLSNYQEYQNPPNWDQFKKNELAEVGKAVCQALGKEEGSHVFCITDDIFYQQRPGSYYNEFYREVEAQVLQKSNFIEANANLRSLAGQIDTRKEEFTLALCKGEDSRFNKGAQVEHYLSHVNDDHTTLYMDDVPENVLEVAKRNPKVISFFFDVKMGDDYNTQALGLAIKAANGDEEARKDLIKVTLEFKEFQTKFDSKEFKEINKISPNTSIADYLLCNLDNDNDWFKAVRRLLTPEEIKRVNNNFVKFEFTREFNLFAD
jgi:hypothetical protein